VRLRQVIINLIKNAQEATITVPDPVIDVSVKQLPDLGYVEISIADNGPGVDNSQIEHIFEPYVTNKDKGTGLGLAIVKKIIEEHGGNIHLQQHEGQGAIFVIRLNLNS
jgi:signal transduction histidine kinase